MAASRVRFLACVAVVALLAPPCIVAAHSRGLRMGRAATRAEEIERQFLQWVRYMGGLQHSTFQPALALESPSYSLVVDKNPAFGDFTSIQAAVDSLPTINLIRVVIKVNAGTYTYVPPERERVASHLVDPLRLGASDDDRREKVTVSPMREFITLEGAGADKTIVQWGDTADKPAGPSGRPLGTFSSSTFAVNAQYFLARNITFKVTARHHPVAVQF
jgi:pectinesterase